MNEKKNIDKLFKEQLKNFDVAPKDHVWENIEERLHENKRKKRRVIPIWWKVAGIAAGLLLLFTLANQFFNNSENDNFSKDIIVDDTNTNNNSKAQEENNSLDETNTSNDILGNDSSEEIVDTSSKSSVEDKMSSEHKNKSNNITSDPTSKALTVSEYSNGEKRKESSKNSSSDNNNNFKEELQQQKRNPIENPLIKDAVANTSKGNSETNQDTQNTVKNKSEIDALLRSNKTDSNTTIADVNTKEKGTSETENNSTEDSQNKEEEEATNAIENAIAEAENTEEKEEEEEQLNRWSVSPSVAPVYFSSLGEGSPLDNQFVENTKASEINMSYGINGSYAVNKKFKIRAGINKVQLGYQTKDVLIFENTSPVARGRRQIANVNLTDSMSQHSIYSARSFKFENAPATLFTQEQGSLDQQLGFIEVPIEVEYNIIERKIGLNLIGGFSTLFLSDNDVYAVLNNGNRTRLGEATNVKDLSYTANFGIGLDYNFSEQFQFNLEPTFKYQINTFNNTSGDFKPFFVGVYTGLSFKF
ncbi:hypothetical protein [Psychroserpens mesophilus]|uniref:hypothetical protein n=1 Tax=Psychroserpens mesophilus TaxID=325473 RepID=UPI000694503E|nr:hypothetical protein [Psychroserpens mesophilus]